MSSLTARKRILFLNATYEVGGAERVLQHLALQLQSQFDAFDVHVCSLYHLGQIGEEMRRQGVPVHPLNGKFRTDPRILPRFLRVIRHIKPHTLFTVDAPIAIAYAALARRLHMVPRLVLAVHSFGKLTRKREIAIARQLASSATDVLIALTETHRQYLLESEGWKAREVVVIPNGVDLRRFTPEGGDLRQAWNLSKDTPTFGIVAQLRPEKNLFRFLRVADRALAAVPEARAFVVGDGELRTDLQLFARTLANASRVTFTGALQDIPAVWRTLDVAVLSSDTEVLPMALIEATACRVPAVSTDVGAIRDVIVHGETGFLAPREDEEALAQHLIYLLEHPQERTRMGSQARLRAEALFDVRTMVKRYADLLAL